MLKDERETHLDDESRDNDLERGDMEEDDGTTPADTQNEEGEPKNKENAEEVAEKQEKKWLDDIKSGKRKLDDMPDNLGWLKKRVADKLDPKEKPDERKGKSDDIEGRIQKVLREERAQVDFDSLVDELKEAELKPDQEARLKEEYEGILSEFENPTVAQKLKALTLASRLIGLTDAATAAQERKRKGMALPPLGRRRNTADKEKVTEIERRLGGNLPPGFKA